MNRLQNDGRAATFGLGEPFVNTVLTPVPRFPPAPPAEASGSSDLRSATKSGFNVENGSAINRFDRTDSQPILSDVTNRYAVKSDRIRPVRRAGGEHSGQAAAWI
jgi:hypothetical protein